ncbi:MAG TPA: hypothetical protein PKD51_18795 [Saprospiraceae bacterium]|nr:hypothetical protein [Saprospiraceae bacterium]
MDNHSMDNKIKKYFEHRTIVPSTKAWDRLDSMLTVAEKPKKRFTIYYMMAFAASLVTILVMFMGPSNEQLENIGVSNKVAVSQNDTLGKEVEVIKNEVVLSKDDMISNVVVNSITSRNSSNTEYSTVPQNDIVINEISSVPPSVATVFPDDNPAKSQQTVDVATTETLSGNLEVNKSNIKIDPEALLASITKIKAAPTKTDAATNAKRRRIDPNTLLDEVENVVAKGFLVRALSSLKETSDEILTSVSNRNQEKQ